MRRDDTKLFLLEGISGSGKSTILRRLNELRNFQDHHWHRWAATKWVYGVLERRDVNLEQLRRDEERIQAIWPTTLVTLVCNPEEALKRKEKMNGEYIENQISKANDLFEIYHTYLTSISNKILIDTSVVPLDKVVEQILARSA